MSNEGLIARGWELVKDAEKGSQVERSQMIERLLRALEAATPTTEGAWQWGVKHSQGIRWEYSEATARQSMVADVKQDDRTQLAYRGRVRLVKRWLGNVIEVENPYETPGVSL